MFQLSDETIQRYSSIKPAYKRIYLTLRQALLSGELSAEEKMPEEALALQLGTSRTPLRRALDDLKREGFLEHAKSAANSTHLPKKDMNSMIDLDVLLESHAAYLAARNGVSPENLEILKDLNRILRNVDESFRYDSAFEKDLIGVRDTHLQFHLMIARMSRNKYLYQTVAELRTKLRQYSSLESFPGDQTPSSYYRTIIVPCHEEIISAIENREPENARAWMYTDVIRSKSKYFNSYKNPYLIGR